MCFDYRLISAPSQVWECTPVTQVLGELRSEGSPELRSATLSLSPKEKIRKASLCRPLSMPGSLFPTSSNTGLCHSVPLCLWVSLTFVPFYLKERALQSCQFPPLPDSSCSLLKPDRRCSKGLQATHPCLVILRILLLDCSDVILNSLLLRPHLCPFLHACVCMWSEHVHADNAYTMCTCVWRSEDLNYHSSGAIHFDF